MERLYSFISGSIDNPLELTPQQVDEIRKIDGVKYFDLVTGNNLRGGSAVLVIENEDKEVASRIWFEVRGKDGLKDKEGLTSETYSILDRKEINNI